MLSCVFWWPCTLFVCPNNLDEFANATNWMWHFSHWLRRKRRRQKRKKKNCMASEPAGRRKGNAQRSLQHSPRSLRYSSHHPFGCGWHHLQHTLWSLSKNWVSILKKLRSLPPSSMCTLPVNSAAKLVHTRRALSSTVINSHQEPFQAKPATLLIPIDVSFPRWRSFTVLGTEVALFP